MKVLSRYIKVLRWVLNPHYRYALARYLRSTPIIEKIRWYTYAALTISLIPIVMLMFMEMFTPLYVWTLVSAVLYFDVVHQYWNVLRISFAYAFIAYVWRLIRSLALVLPVNASRHLRSTARS